MVNIFHYRNYREYLLELYKEQKAKYPKFSHRYVAQKVGFKSSGLFANILKGKSNISGPLIFKFIDFLKLKKREAEYFQLLVQFNQAKVYQEKAHFFEKISSFKEARITQIGSHQEEYFSKWYYGSIRELLKFYSFKDNYQYLAKKVVPEIKPEEAKKAIHLLEKLDLIRKDDKGGYKPVDAFLISEGIKKSHIINKYHADTIDRAREAIERFPNKERTISSLTLSVSDPMYDTIAEKIKSFCEELFKLALSDKSPASRAYQLNFQVFPITKKILNKNF